MTSKYFKLLKDLRLKHKENTRNIINCLEKIKSLSYSKDTTLQDIFLNHDFSYIEKQITRYCINGEEYKPYEHKDFNDAIFDFFILKVNCPKNIKNCDELRIIYKNKLANLKESKNCNKCSENLLNLYFIKSYLEPNYIEEKL